MKRLISLITLVLCSFIISFGATQTWRLTDNAYSDSLPQIAIRNDGSVWVAWIGENGISHDAYGINFNGSSWSSVDQLTNDSVNQRRCLLANNVAANELVAAWDSGSSLLTAKYDGAWSTTETVHNDIWDDRFALCSNEYGRVYYAWSVNTYAGVWLSGKLRSYSGASWDTIQTIFSPGAIYSDAFFVYDIDACHSLQPLILYARDWSSIMGNSGSEFGFCYFGAGDSLWRQFPFDSCNFWDDTKAMGIRKISDDTMLVCYRPQDNPETIRCDRYLNETTLDTTFAVVQNSPIQAGKFFGGIRPTMVWSDSQKIYASAFYDSMWSTIPTQISDDSLTNCMNPDVAVENDSTMWVCYECDNEIYVTKTSVPLGITGNRPEQKKIPIKPCIQAYPNPASNRVNISYTNRGQSEFSIYDIAGARIRSLTADNGQAVWDCRNQQGHRVSSGVYFIRAVKDNNEIIKKINVVR